jgi:hypothetical protein
MDDDNVANANEVRSGCCGTRACGTCELRVSRVYLMALTAGAGVGPYVERRLNFRVSFRVVRQTRHPSSLADLAFVCGLLEL